MRRSKDEMIDALVSEIGDYQDIAREASSACWRLIKRLELLVDLPDRSPRFVKWVAQITTHAQTVIDSIDKQVRGE